MTGGADNIGGNYRFSAQNDNGQFASNSPLNWGGGWLHSVGTTLWQASTGTIANYMSTTNINGNNAMAVVDPTVARSGTFSGNSATSYLWTMSITRDSISSVDLVSSFIGGSGNYSETYTKNDDDTSVFTYNSIGILTTGATDLDQLSISNAQFSVIPEPSTTLLGGLGLLALLRRRRN